MPRQAGRNFTFTISLSSLHHAWPYPQREITRQGPHSGYKNTSPSPSMNFELYQDVILTVDLPREGLCAGDVGTLVERHVVPGMEEGCSVEFFDMTGGTVAVVTVPRSSLRAPTAADRPSARRLDGVAG